jgi:hypothetical protein
LFCFLVDLFFPTTGFLPNHEYHWNAKINIQPWGVWGVTACGERKQLLTTDCWLGDASNTRERTLQTIQVSQLLSVLRVTTQSSSACRNLTTPLQEKAFDPINWVKSPTLPGGDGGTIVHASLYKEHSVDAGSQPLVQPMGNNNSFSHFWEAP